eukprot:3844869-Amphidinium_carterae.1
MWKTLSTLFSIARIGTRKDVKLAYLLTQRLLQRVSGFMASYLLMGLVCRLLPAHEPALVPKAGVTTVWTDGSGRHSSNPHFRRCGVGYVTDTGERCWMALPGCRQSVFRAELLA